MESISGLVPDAALPVLTMTTTNTHTQLQSETGEQTDTINKKMQKAWPYGQMFNKICWLKRKNTR